MVTAEYATGKKAGNYVGGNVVYPLWFNLFVSIFRCASTDCSLREYMEQVVYVRGDLLVLACSQEVKIIEHM